jgi:UDP-glucose 4-epimerase
MIELINAELGTDIDPKYIENPLDEYVHDTMADYAKLHEATGWEPTIAFEEGVSRVCDSYH